MKPIPFNALAKLLGQRHVSQILITGVAIDSRKVNEGDLFFALPGNRVDGHQFLKEAKEKGAVAAIVQQDFHGDTFDLPILKVNDVLETLQDLARKKLQQRSVKVVAITGSIGKTTTKEFAKTFLQTKYRVFSSPLSYNSQATVPLTILMSDETEEVLLLEMGMTHKGQIEKLVSIAPPDIAVLTTVALQHVNNFPDGLSGIRKEKASIFSHPKTTLGIAHRDIADFDEIARVGNCFKRSFSIQDKSADYYLEMQKKGVRIYFENNGFTDLEVSFPIKAYFQNFLASIAIARSLDVPWPFIQEVIPYLKLPAMRFERIEKKGVIFINDAYNANPDSMKAALEGLPEPKVGGKRVAVLSEMDALGTYSEISHRNVAETALECTDVLYCIGSRCRIMQEVWETKKRNFVAFESKEKLLEKLRESVAPGDVVLLKGARAYALENILENF